MSRIRNFLPLTLAILFGVLALIGLLLLPPIARLLTNWVSFLSAIALLIGILNLLNVHTHRILKGNAYSIALVLSLLAMILLGVTDWVGVTEAGVSTLFDYVQAPLEAAVASMLAFFLLFSGARVLQRQKSWWALVFIVSVILFLLGKTPLPGFLSDLFIGVSDFLTMVFVSSGIRGILIGIALGAMIVTLRVLMGTDRPYDR
jgi:hypothetical protein